jgi:hypothetical protein
MDNYRLLKSLHVLGVVIFLGNIIVTAVWKALADRTGSPAIVAYGIVNLVGIDAKSGRDGNDDVGLRDCRSTERFEARKFAPLCEATAHDLPVVMSRQQMPTRTKKRRDRPER